MEVFLASAIAYFGKPLLEHIHGRVNKEVADSVDALFTKMTLALPWKKRPSTLREAHAAMEQSLRQDSLLAKQTAVLAQQTGLLAAVREYAHTHQNIQHIDNANATIDKQTNIQQAGDVRIG